MSPLLLLTTVVVVVVVCAQETMPRNRYLSCAVQDAWERYVYVIGGFDGQRNYDAADELLALRTSTREWTVTPERQMRVGGGACAFIGDREKEPALFMVAGGTRVMAPGGTGPVQHLHASQPVDSTYILRANEAGDELVQVYRAELPAPRIGGTLCRVADAPPPYTLFYAGGSAGNSVDWFEDTIFAFDQISWVELNEMRLPTPRAFHHVSVSGSRMYVFGGLVGPQTPAPPDTVMYVDFSPHVGQWHAKALPRVHTRNCVDAFGVWLPDLELYLGGVSHDGGRACTARSNPSLSVSVGSAWVRSHSGDTLRVFGGVSSIGASDVWAEYDKDSLTATTAGVKYAPSDLHLVEPADVSVRVPDAHLPENGGTFLIDDESRVYALGGSVASAFGVVLESSLFSEFDQRQKRWTARGAQSHSQSFACLVGSDRRYLYSVSSSWNSAFSGYLMRYDREQDRWDQYSSSSAPAESGTLLASRACAMLRSAAVVAVVGGYRVPAREASSARALHTAARPLSTRATSALASLYDMQTDQWRKLPRLPTPVAEAVASFDERTGTLYVSGGLHHSILLQEPVSQLLFAQKLDGKTVSDKISSKVLAAASERWTVLRSTAAQQPLRDRETLTLVLLSRSNSQLLVYPEQCLLADPVSGRAITRIAPNECDSTASYRRIQMIENALIPGIGRALSVETVSEYNVTVARVNVWSIVDPSAASATTVAASADEESATIAASEEDKGKAIVVHLNTTTTTFVLQNIDYTEIAQIGKIRTSLALSVVTCMIAFMVSIIVFSRVKEGA